MAPGREPAPRGAEGGTAPLTPPFLHHHHLLLRPRAPFPSRSAPRGTCRPYRPGCGFPSPSPVAPRRPRTRSCLRGDAPTPRCRFRALRIAGSCGAAAGRGRSSVLGPPPEAPRLQGAPAAVRPLPRAAAVGSVCVPRAAVPASVRVVRGARGGCAPSSPSAVFSTERPPSLVRHCGLKIRDSGLGAFIFLLVLPMEAWRHK